jgi:uncharacterized membrane protein
MPMRLVRWPRHACESRLQGDRGSALMLMPAAVLIILVLGAIAVDMSVVHLAKRDLINIANSAANDAATFGLDPKLLRRDFVRQIDLHRARQAIERNVQVRDPKHRIVVLPPTVTRNSAGLDVVTVTLRMKVEYIFAKALPGIHEVTVEAEGRSSPISR